MPGDLQLMRDAFKALSPHQRENATDWLVGVLSAHVTAEQWQEAVQSSVEIAIGPGLGRRTRDAQDDHKKAAAGERVEA